MKRWGGLPRRSHTAGRMQDAFRMKGGREHGLMSRARHTHAHARATQAATALAPASIMHHEADASSPSVAYAHDLRRPVTHERDGTTHVRGQAASEDETHGTAEGRQNASGTRADGTLSRGRADKQADTPLLRAASRSPSPEPDLIDTPPSDDEDDSEQLLRSYIGGRTDEQPTRPPPRLLSKQIAAAARLGMQSAGLAWLDQAEAASASRATNREPKDPTATPPPPREEPGRAEHDVPLMGEPPRHPREIMLPVPENFVFPEFAFIAFYEHTGEEREANAAVLNQPTCSVADRRSVLPPSEGCYHFIGKVQDFIAVFPHPIRRQTNHVTCGWANWASWRTWAAKILDGSMRRAAEEFLWINCLGDRSWGEQPPTAHQHTIGPPTFTMNGNQHGAANKTYCIWARNCPEVPPSDKVPKTQQWSELAVSGTPEQKTIKRSYWPRNVAMAQAKAHARLTGGDTSEFGRPAAQPCKQYDAFRQQLAHNFGLLSAHFAPTLTSNWLHSADRDAAIVLVPIAQSNYGPCAMISLQQPDAVFGVARDWTMSGMAQGEQAAAFLRGDAPTQYAARLEQFDKADAVVLVPWAAAPMHVIRHRQQRAEARDAGLSAVWCTLDAVDGHISAHAIALAFKRVEAMTTIGEHGGLQSGTWATSKPLVHFRSARAWSRQHDAPQAAQLAAAEAFFNEEARRGQELRACFAALDRGDGDMMAIADSIRTAADYRAEIPFPAQGLPSFEDSSLRLLRFAERPLRLSTKWLARLPPQQVPPGFTPQPWTQIVRGWARRRVCKALNRTAARDFECWEKGESSKQRPAFECIGHGGGKHHTHADGIGTWNALSIVWEWDPTLQLYDKLDYQRKGRTHWVLNMLRRIFGEHDDAQIMSIIMDGVRWGIEAPKQIRIAPNLERMDGRIRGVGAAFKKLIDKGLYYKIRRLRRQHESIDPEGVGPFVIIPPYIVGSGGTDKPDNPTEKRIVGNQGDPHPEQAVRERNAPHGIADGPITVSTNDMMGPQPSAATRGKMLDASRYPMPHPENKVRPRQEYGDNAVLSHMAWLGETYLAATKDDGRHMFFQFEMSPEEERTCSFTVLVELPLLDEGGQPVLDENGQPILELWFVLIIATCMNMGTRNASKIAQRFTDRLLEGFSRLLDIYVKDVWMAKQTPALQALLAERARVLGSHQARPFSTAGYTDDYAIKYVGPELSSVGTSIWRSCNRKANYWLSAKCGAGTVIDFIGGREVLNGGFGCMPPTKHTRAIHDTIEAIEGRITREQLESHNSFLVHVGEWLDFPLGTLKGLSAPLKPPGRLEDLAHIGETTRDQFKAVLDLLTTRHAASFWSGVDEAPTQRAGGIVGTEGILFAPRFASDSCSDVERPFICGMAGGLFFRFELSGDWRFRHITLTEACGTVLMMLVFPRYFPHLQLLLESDATSALATVAATASSDDLTYLRRRAEQEPSYREAIERAWCTHVKGWANGAPDAGSRDKMQEFYALAAAFGMRLREVPIPEAALALMRDVLANTADTRKGGVESGSTSRGSHNPSMDGNEPFAHGVVSKLLDALGSALTAGNDAIEADRRANDIATHFGSAQIKSATRRDIIAAYYAIRRREKYPRDQDAWEAAGASRAGFGTWKRRIEAALKEELRGRAGKSKAAAAASQPGSSTDTLQPSEAATEATLPRPAATPLPSVTTADEQVTTAPQEALQAPTQAAAEATPLEQAVPQAATQEATPTHEDTATAAQALLALREAGPDTEGHATSQGTHNINMDGRPISHGTRPSPRTEFMSTRSAAASSCDPERYYELGGILWRHGTGATARKEAQSRARGSTTRGRGNPNMDGNHPFAHPSSPATQGGEPLEVALWCDVRLPPPHRVTCVYVDPPEESTLETALTESGELSAQMAVAAASEAEVSELAEALARDSHDTPPTLVLSIMDVSMQTARTEATTRALAEIDEAVSAVRMVAAFEAARKATIVGGDDLIISEDELSFTPHTTRQRVQPPPRQQARGGRGGRGGRGTRGSTTRGRQNLNLDGNMPISHGGAPVPVAGAARRKMLGLRGGGDHLADSPMPVIARPRTRSSEPSTARPTDDRELTSPVAMAAAPATAPEEPGGTALSPLGRVAAGNVRATPKISRGGDALSPEVAKPAGRYSPRVIRAAASTTAVDDAIEELAPRNTSARSASPQPETAQAARHAAARDVATRLAGDSSEYALFPDRPDVLRGIVIEAAETRDAGIPKGTRTSDEWGFAWARRFGAETNNRWMRSRAANGALAVLREVYFTVILLIWITQMMAPSARRRREGYGQGKPTSALLAVYAFRRVMRDCGRYLPDMSEVRGVFKGICMRYKARWGDEAFVPHRKMPFRAADLRAMVSLLAASAVQGWAPVLCSAMLVALCYALSTGARKDEWTLSFEGDTLVRRSNFVWVDEITYAELPNTPEVIQSRRRGCLLKGRSAASKCDRLNVEWGSRDQYFRYDERNPLNFAWRWQQWELAYPCPIDARGVWPAFSPSGDAAPFTGQRADSCLQTVMAAVMSAAQAAKHSWHACRITLATRLFARRGGDIARDEIEGVIQSLVRWKTLEAMRIYARMEPGTYADYVDMGTREHDNTPDGIPEDMPEVDPEHVAAEHADTIAALDAEAAAARKAARSKEGPAADVPRAAPAKRRRPSTGTGDTSGAAAAEIAPELVFDLGEGISVSHMGDDSWGLIGQRLSMCNSFWGYTDGLHSDCVVAAYIGDHTFPSGPPSRHTYVIEHEGHHYAVRHSTVARSLTDVVVKRRVSKSKHPHLVRS